MPKPLFGDNGSGVQDPPWGILTTIKSRLVAGSVWIKPNMRVPV